MAAGVIEPHALLAEDSDTPVLLKVNVTPNVIRRRSESYAAARQPCGNFSRRWRIVAALIFVRAAHWNFAQQAQGEAWLGGRRDRTAREAPWRAHSLAERRRTNRCSRASNQVKLIGLSWRAHRGSPMPWGVAPPKPPHQAVQRLDSQPPLHPFRRTPLEVRRTRRVGFPLFVFECSTGAPVPATPRKRKYTNPSPS